MEYVQEITLDLNSNNTYTSIGAKQGDSNSRLLQIHITENGNEFIIPDGTTAIFRFKKPDGTSIMDSATIDYDTNTVKIVFSAQALAISGRGYADVALYGSRNELLSTISFMVIIMSSPNIAVEGISSNEFRYLQSVVNDATTIIQESEAWANGQRNGEEVTGESFTATPSTSLFTCVVNQNVFKDRVGVHPGATYSYTFTYTNEKWYFTADESGEKILEEINDLEEEYGITVSGTLQDPNYIYVTVTDADLQYHNNAKYWAEQAEISRQFIEDLTITAHRVDPNEGASAEKKGIIDGKLTFDFAIPQGIQGEVGPQGPVGPIGPVGPPIQIVGTVNTVNDLPSSATQSTMYNVGEHPPYNVYIYDNGTWRNLGGIQGPAMVIAGTVSTVQNLPSSASQSTLYNVGTEVPYDVYMYDNGIWRNLGKLQGPQGIQGIQGPVGPIGPTISVSGIEKDANDNVPQVVIGTGAPTTSTVGYINQLRLDSETGILYICTNISGNTYTWMQTGYLDNSYNFAVLEESPTLTSHNPGDYLFYNNTFYKAKISINPNVLLVVGTNIEQVDVGSELNKRQNKITASGILKGNSGAISAATKGTDYGANSFTVTLQSGSANWQNNAQTINDAKFVKTGYVYIVSPKSNSLQAYSEAMIYADDVTTAGKMTFHCEDIPSSNLTINITRIVSA